MTRIIDIRLADVRCSAMLHDDAPVMSGLLWDALPLTGELRHLRWGGEAGYVLSAAVKTENPADERRVSMYGRGQILLRAEHGEVAIGYGQGQARDGVSRGSEACHVASVVTNAEAFLDRVARTRRGGKAPIEITRSEGDGCSSN
jgi:hypothetical protein